MAVVFVIWLVEKNKDSQYLPYHTAEDFNRNFNSSFLLTII